MTANYLFPHSFKKVGWIMLVPFLLLGILTVHFDYNFGWLTFDFREKIELFESSSENFTNELAGIGLIISLLLIAFSRIKVEDEYSLQLRHDSLTWGIYVYYIILIIAFLFTYFTDFLLVMVYSLYAPLIIYIIRFHYYLWRNEKLSES